MRAAPFDSTLVEQIEIRMIRPSGRPVRAPDARGSRELAELRDSIREHGLLQPVVVRPLAHGFEAVAGHRRLAACRSLRWRFVPCKICELTDRQAYEIQLAENLQRKTMDPVEEAEAYQRYVTEFGWGGVSELGRRIGKSEEYVSHRMQLLRLPGGVRERVAGGGIGVSQAIEIATAPAGVAGELAARAEAGGLTVRRIREIKRGAALAGAQAAEPGSAEGRIVRRGTLALRVALSRIDDLIEDAHRAPAAERAALVGFLMGLRRTTHAMIDEAIRYRRGAERARRRRGR